MVLSHEDHEVESGSSRCRPLDDSTNTPTLSDVVQLALQQHGHLDASLLKLDLMKDISNDVSMDDSIAVSDDSSSDEDVTCFTKTVKSTIGMALYVGNCRHIASVEFVMVKGRVLNGIHRKCGCGALNWILLVELRQEDGTLFSHVTGMMRKHVEN
ncbi:hypothetical protein L1987_35572 [Smallanthus sonchifolius]|uniref:Uncharacterized protein n=1 Tax=Smallanthus sonchifolius TaxID=185202 RepID=A0ACB9HB37_9ASTR|nr:hypothetical protein L1987_35572 [Smallanthus sonchifolius]